MAFHRSGCLDRRPADCGSTQRPIDLQGAHEGLASKKAVAEGQVRRPDSSADSASGMGLQRGGSTRCTTTSKYAPRAGAKDSGQFLGLNELRVSRRYTDPHDPNHTPDWLSV